ncbi:MAG TPA: DUF4142 domain-containing protein [Polyangia bacterium]|jgi:putative membrane protein
MQSLRLRIAFRLALVVAAGVALAARAGAEPRKLSPADQNLVKNLAQSHVAGVKLGRLAAQRGSNPAVKAFGQRVSQDRATLITEMNMWASSHQVALPTAIRPEQSAELKKLQGLSGPAFDQEYMRYALQAHRTDVTQLQQGAQQAQDPNVQGLATKALPVLQGNLGAAQTVAAQVGVAP